MNFLRLENRSLRTTGFVILITSGTLHGWNREFDDHMKPITVPDNRGKNGVVTVEIVRNILKAADDYEKPIKIEAFNEWLCTQAGIKLSSKTVKEILIANGLFAPSTQKKRPRFFKNLQQRIPNGLISIDGSELEVMVDDQVEKFNLEMSVDVFSFTHTAFSISDTETTEEFINVLEKHRLEWGCPVGVLSDHGSSNISEKAMNYLDSLGIEPVPAGPGNPKGNGTDEGAFSQLKEIIGMIKLDTSSPRALAKSVLEIIINVYVKMRNKLCLHGESISPQSKMIIPVDKETKDSARQHLQNHNNKKIQKDTDQPKIDRLYFLIKNQNLDVDTIARNRAEKSIKAFEMKAIIEAEKAFIKAVNRKMERNDISYFFGILKRIQQERDDNAYQEHCRSRYNYEQMLEIKRQEQERLEEQQKKPEIHHIVAMLRQAINASQRFIKDLALRRVTEWVEQLAKGYKYIGPLKKKIEHAIAKETDLTREDKEKIWLLIEGILNPKIKGESVT